MNDERDEIRRRVDIVSLVSREVSLKKTGKNFVGLCPFHPDKNPSMTVSPDTGRYKCWSCGAGGDIFNWVMARQNVDFPEAIKILAKDAGIELKSHDPLAAQKRRDREGVMEAALAFFRSALQQSEVARDYVTSRELSPELIAAWEIGYAPSQGQALTSALIRDGYSLAEAKQLFLVDTDASDGYYDKFRGRLMFPIRDERGVLVAFGGRIIGAGQPKYINSSDTPIYRKSRVLYGMNRAKATIQSSQTVLLVEGYLDVIACHTVGITNAVASLGTALATDQADLIKRWANQVVILYDSDEAGQKATERALPILATAGLKSSVALLPDGEDPDTARRAGDSGLLLNCVEKAMPPVDYRLLRLGQRLKPVDEAYWSEIPEILAGASNELELDRYLMKIAPQYPGTSDPIAAVKSLRAMVIRHRAPKNRLQSATVAYGEQPRVEISASELAVFVSFLSEELRQDAYLFARTARLFYSSDAIELANAVLLAFPGGPPTGPVFTWLHRIEPESNRELLARLMEDFRGQAIDLRVLNDAIQMLKEKAAVRQEHPLRVDRKADYFTELRRRKGLPDQEGDPDIEDFFDGRM